MSRMSERAKKLQKSWHYLLEAIAYRDCSKSAGMRGDVEWAATYRRAMRLSALLYRQEAGIASHD